jgi:DNA/RNA-binding domain of Phe-tRNA-synthetase-like protein
MRDASQTLTLSIDSQVLSRFPSLKVIGFSAANLEAVSLTPAVLRDAWKRTAAALARRGITSGDVSRLWTVRQWRSAFGQCGLSAPAFTGSVETLLRGALTAGAVASTVPLTGLCSAIAARHMAPIRGWDVDALPESTVTVRFSKPATDWFLPLQARPTDLQQIPGAVVCAAGDTVLCWSFNYRESRQTCLSTESTRALFTSEALSRRQAAASADGIEELRRQLARRGATVSALVCADAASPRIELGLTRT